MPPVYGKAMRSLREKAPQGGVPEGKALLPWQVERRFGIQNMRPRSSHCEGTYSFLLEAEPNVERAWIKWKGQSSFKKWDLYPGDPVDSSAPLGLWMCTLLTASCCLLVSTTFNFAPYLHTFSPTGSVSLVNPN